MKKQKKGKNENIKKLKEYLKKLRRKNEVLFQNK